MMDRLREFFSLEAIEGKPKDWEAKVSQSYEFLQNEIKWAEEARNSGDFYEFDRSQRMKRRIGSLKDGVLEAVRKDNPGFIYPSYIPLMHQGNAYFYVPSENQLKTGTQIVRPPSQFGFGIVTTGPRLADEKNIDDKIWCLNQDIVVNITILLFDFLPKDSSRRILNPVNSKS